MIHQIRLILLIFPQIPTCLLYDEYGRVIAWGLEAKNASPMAETLKCEWFKLFLEPKVLRDESAVDPRLPFLPVRINSCNFQGDSDFSNSQGNVLLI
jgi:hypothetical protein